MTFRDMTIRKKLLALLMSAGISALLLASVVFYVMTINNFRKSYEDDVTGLARVLARNCEASLAFQIPEEAERVLASLSVRPSVVYAVILNQRGNIFARYGRNPFGSGGNKPVTDNLSMIQSPDYFKAKQDIMIGGSAIGSLVVFDDMRGIKNARLIASSMLFFAVLISMCATLLMVPIMHRFIAKPIVELSSAAKRIAAAQDFSLRAKKYGNDEVGQLVETFNAMIEQIEKRNAELIASEKRFRTLVDQAVDAFFLFDTDGAIIDVNQRACESLGYTRDELLSMTFLDIAADTKTGDYDDTPRANLQALAAYTNEGMHRRKDGTTFAVEMRIGPLEIGGRFLFMGLARDISERQEAEAERRKLEFQLQQAQKMEAIGALAGGIAHDFNNILTAIIGYAELAMIKLPEKSPVIEDLEQVARAGARATDLVKQILTFSRQRIHELTPVKIDIIIKEAVKLLRASIPTSIEIHQNIDPNCGYVLANPTQIHQILMNLCTNAYHAMRETGGALGISLENALVAPEDVAPLHLLSPGRYVKLTVSDTGCGMDTSTLERIFEPYFTTKPTGEGTGMGLSVVHGIVKSFQGHISVYSEPGQGSTFHVYLPRIDVAQDKETVLQKPLERGSEHLLIVDDEELIVDMERKILTDLGYAITACSSPAQALEAFLANPDSFDLVITDMTMPGMLGTELAEKMLRVKPGVPIILCTGFSDRVNEKTARSMGIMEYVMKPIVFSEFSRTIRRVLDIKASGEA